MAVRVTILKAMGYIWKETQSAKGISQCRNASELRDGRFLPTRRLADLVIEGALALINDEWKSGASHTVSNAFPQSSPCEVMLTEAVCQLLGDDVEMILVPFEVFVHRMSSLHQVVVCG